MSTEQHTISKTTASATGASATSAPATAAAPADTSSVDQKEASTKRRPLAERLAALEASKARLAKRVAALTKEARRERNGQLIVWGIMSELTYQKGDAATRQRMKAAAANMLKGRDLARALAGFARLDEEITNNGNTTILDPR